jgi:hypothetical protein
MTELRNEYENGSIAFVKQIDWLMDKGFKFVRRTRGACLSYFFYRSSILTHDLGDGDCFYRCDDLLPLLPYSLADQMCPGGHNYNLQPSASRTSIISSLSRTLNAIRQ